MMIPIVRGLEGTSYDQEDGTPISVSKKSEKTKSGFQTFVDKDMQRSLFRAKERDKGRSITLLLCSKIDELTEII